MDSVRPVWVRMEKIGAARSGDDAQHLAVACLVVAAMNAHAEHTMSTSIRIRLIDTLHSACDPSQFHIYTLQQLPGSSIQSSQS
jgi:hypothetical protein